MTKPENFLTRWSRRKQRTSEDGEAKPSTPLVPDNSTSASEPAPVPKNVSIKPMVDIASLPPVESITAETDIRAFLAPGVPRDLAAAALRRAWTTDPVIRDFVGLAEYAWDFDAPGSMAGFGPLEITDDLRRVVAQIVGGSSGENCLPDAANEQISSENSPAQDSPEPACSHAVQELPQCDVSSASEAVTAAPRSKVEKSDVTKPILRRRHGRALPK